MEKRKMAPNRLVNFGHTNRRLTDVSRSIVRTIRTAKPTVWFIVYRPCRV